MTDTPITKQQLDALERAADKVFGKLGIDIEFTRHFLDRVNDERNQKQITIRELGELFVKEYKRWGKAISQMPINSQAVMKDLSSAINIPFVLNKDGKETDLVAKTVMRKPNFTTPDKTLPVESVSEAGQSDSVRIEADQAELYAWRLKNVPGLELERNSMSLGGEYVGQRIVTNDPDRGSFVFSLEPELYRRVKDGSRAAKLTTQQFKIMRSDVEAGELHPNALKNIPVDSPGPDDIDEDMHGAKRGTQVKGRDATPSKRKPTTAGSSPHPMRGKLVGEEESVIKEAKLSDAIPALEKELNTGAGFDRKVFQLDMGRRSRAPGTWGFGSAGGGIMIRWSTYGAQSLADERGVDVKEVIKEARQYMKQWLQQNTKPITVFDRDSRETKQFYIKGGLAFDDNQFYVRVNTKRMLQNPSRFEIKEGIIEDTQVNEIFGLGKKAQKRRGAEKIASDIMITQIIEPVMKNYNNAFEGIKLEKDKGDYIVTGYGFNIHLDLNDVHLTALESKTDGRVTHYVQNGLAGRFNNDLRNKYREWKEANKDDVISEMVTEPAAMTTFAGGFRNADGNSEQNIVINFRILDGGTSKKLPPRGKPVGEDASSNEMDAAPLDVKTLTPAAVAEKHNVSLSEIKAQLKQGIAIEMEHTTDRDVAREIALDHLMELPDYYDRLQKIEEVDVDFFMQQIMWEEFQLNERVLPSAQAILLAALRYLDQRLEADPVKSRNLPGAAFDTARAFDIGASGRELADMWRKWKETGELPNATN